MRSVSSPRSTHRRALLRARATCMRRAPTASEQLLWLQLRSKQLGVQFRRQVVLGEFIVDFFASSARLVVEVDGGYHTERSALDARRDAALQRVGYRGSGLRRRRSCTSSAPCFSASAKRWGLHRERSEARSRQPTLRSYFVAQRRRPSQHAPSTARAS